VPLLPASLTEPLWVQFSTLLRDDDRPEFVADHPWGCHRRRIPDRVVFDHVLAALVHGSGYARIALPGCSDRTIRRRLLDWAERDVGVELLKAALAAYDQMIGLDDLSLDGSITKSPCGGELPGRSPVDRGKQGTKRSVVTDGHRHPPRPWSASPPAPTGTTHRCSNPHAPDPGHDRAAARPTVCAPGPRL